MSWMELVAAAEAIREAAAAAHGVARLGSVRVSGVGWATVDAERAFGELATLFSGAAMWVAQERQGLLGAKVWHRAPPPDGGVELFVLEPDTEGRLAAFLARHGEGVAALYVVSKDDVDEHIVAVEARWGPYVVVRSDWE